MSREVKRVPLDFSWPLHKTWAGYCNPFYWIDSLNLSDEVKEKYGEMFEPIDPPKGDGWQTWETTSEGSAISPVFKTPEELAYWLANNKASAFGNQTATYSEWLAMIAKGHAISGV